MVVTKDFALFKAGQEVSYLTNRHIGEESVANKDIATMYGVEGDYEFILVEQSSVYIPMEVLEIL